MQEDLFLLLICGDLLQQPDYYYQTSPDSDEKQMVFWINEVYQDNVSEFLVIKNLDIEDDEDLDLDENIDDSSDEEVEQEEEEDKEEHKEDQDDVFI